MIDVEYEDKKAAENHLKQPIKAPDKTVYSQGLTELPKREIKKSERRKKRMRAELKEMLEDKLDSFVSEYLNEQAKGSEGISIANPELRYYKGYIDGMCCALNCKSWGLENGYWVIRDGHNHIVVSRKNAREDED